MLQGHPRIHCALSCSQPPGDEINRQKFHSIVTQVKENYPHGCSKHRVIKSLVLWPLGLADNLGIFYYFFLAGGEGCVCLEQLYLVWFVIGLRSPENNPPGTGD